MADHEKILKKPSLHECQSCLEFFRIQRNLSNPPLTLTCQKSRKKNNKFWSKSWNRKKQQRVINTTRELRISKYSEIKSKWVVHHQNSEFSKPARYENPNWPNSVLSFNFRFRFSILNRFTGLQGNSKRKTTYTQIEGAKTCARPQIQCQTSHPAAVAAKEKSTQRWASEMDLRWVIWCLAWLHIKPRKHLRYTNRFLRVCDYSRSSERAKRWRGLRRQASKQS